MRAQVTCKEWEEAYEHARDFLENTWDFTEDGGFEMWAGDILETFADVFLSFLDIEVSDDFT